MIKTILPILFLQLLFACNHTVKQPDAIIAKSSPDTATAIVVQVSAEQLITPGQGIGHLSILQNTDSVMMLLGRPDSSDAAMGSSLMVWFAHHNRDGYKTVIFAHRNMGNKDESNRVKQIMVTSPWFKTATGIGAGLTLSDIQKQYQVKPTAIYSSPQNEIKVYDDVDKGISFDIDSISNKCVAVTVHAAKDSSGTYLNMH